MLIFIFNGKIFLCDINIYPYHLIDRMLTTKLYVIGEASLQSSPKNASMSLNSFATNLLAILFIFIHLYSAY